MNLQNKKKNFNNADNTNVRTTKQNNQILFEVSTKKYFKKY